MLNTLLHHSIFTVSSAIVTRKVCINDMKHTARTLLVLYGAFLVWLILLKLTTDPTSLTGNTRELNLMPFAHYSQSNIHELIYNFLVFIPFGLLLGIVHKRGTIWSKFVIVIALSLTLEIFQLMFAMGIADITDLITNSFGGLVGLVMYTVGSRYMNRGFDHLVVTICSMILVLLVLFSSTITIKNSNQSPVRPGTRPRLQNRVQ